MLNRLQSRLENKVDGGSEPIRQIVYVSASYELLEKHALAELLRSSRTRNVLMGITGALLHHGGNFMQAIEGPAHAIAALFARIFNDKRHHGLIQLLDEPCGERDFDGMPLASGPNARQLSANWLPGDPPPAGASVLSLRAGGPARDLLASFTP